MPSLPLTGLIAAAPTPMHGDGSLRLEQIAPLVEHLIAARVAGLYVVGSTGEGPSLTTPERQQVAEAFIAAARGRLPVVVQVGHNSVEEARTLAAHAQRAGAAAVSATSPSYFKPASVEVLVDCLARIAGGAPQLPFYYYHIPSLAGVALDLPTLLRQAGARVPNFRGLKFTAPSVWEYQACLAVDDGRFDCLFGLDEMLLPALSVGARGAIGSTYNFAAPIYRRLFAAFERGDLQTARAEQARSVAMCRVLHAHGGFPAIKAAMQLIGVDCGPVRLPQQPLPATGVEKLRHDLDSLGFFSWLKED